MLFRSTTATIKVTDLDQLGQAGKGECTFKTADDSASATVTLQGEDLCLLYTSPLPAGCPTTPTVQHPLAVVINSGATAGSYSVTSAPSGVMCSVPASSTSSCTPSEFGEGVTVTLTTTGPAGATFTGWAGDCVAVGGSPQKATVIMSSGKSCTATWSP